uniref:RING-type E3 ubiquitin transferase n=1 Tax=Podarcis muralis TaxID=64176 RepID=A0A670HRS0_PODMU
MAAAAAAAASAAALGVRAAGSPPPPPLLRRGRGRRRRRQGGPEEKEAAAEGGGPRRCPPQGPGRPFCRSRLGSFSQPVRAPSEGETPPPPPPPPPPPAQAERDFIFRAPITLSKPGELHEEYKSQLRKLRDEKLQEERTSDDFIHKLIVEDTTDAGKRKTEDQKKEESLMVKMTQERFPERLSDSENEEPFQGKSAHRSAFVSKGSTYSIALVAGSLSSKVERSQSCNDTLRERSKSRQRSAPINQLSGTPAPLIGVLSSTQNNRCLSAPDLTADKRLVFHAAASFSVLQKPERSISPESNDSISEELNHFKPIVCSPCTPPKQLPDGGVLSPLIIKSTPRNLTRSLQKPTTYEASPRILKKWEQIFQERQVKKTLSKATLTSLAPEAGEDFLVPSANSLVKEPPQISNDVLPPESITHMQAATDCSPSVSRPNESTLNARIPEVPSAKAALRQTETCLNVDAKMVTRKVIRVSSEFPENGALGPSVKAAGRKQLKYLNESERSNFPNGVCLEKALGDEASPLRRGRKRQCKMKHLEQAGSVKRLRQVACHHGALAAPEPPRKRRRSEVEQRLKQEEEDRRLALQLQRKFDSENRTVARRKGRADQYFLRSKSTTGAK